ncbi:MAG: PIG-L family deacetylase [Niabella sp.]
MKYGVLFFIVHLFWLPVTGQAPQTCTASQILQHIKKLNVLGAVLYIAAHPDDENTRLITYLANDKLYRTGYLSLTRGDGGQNLIGDEQGIELGLIRTQELLAARRIDGGEQFFTRAYDFGFSRNPEETFNKWDKEKILGDVVWVIRNFRPDVIITRFPTTGEGGHGHHTASAILANEAYAAAADPKRFPEQLKYVKPWQAKRIMWNTFNFGGNNTTDPAQFNINVGGFNPLLGKSYGELAAESRSQHKSQGFGSAPARGDSYEYFKTTGGNAPGKDLLDDVDITWNRIGPEGASVQKMIAAIETDFDPAAPQKSVTALVQLYNTLGKITGAPYWINEKKAAVQQLIQQCCGLFIDTYANQPYAVQTDSIEVWLTVNSRLADNVIFKGALLDVDFGAQKALERNKNNTWIRKVRIPLTKEITQPYWLKEPMDENAYHVEDQLLIGKPDAEPAYTEQVTLNIAGTDFVFEKPVQYKYTDPVKGEIYQPLCIVPPATLTAAPGLLIFNKDHSQSQTVQTQLHANTGLQENIIAGLTGIDYSGVQYDSNRLEKGNTKTYNFTVTDHHQPQEVFTVSAYANTKNRTGTTGYYLALKNISYDHIPAVRYFYPDFITVLNIDLKTAGKRIGYIPGAGDKEAAVLERMGYDVTILDKSVLVASDLKIFDAIITGVRAYNTNEWMNDFYDKLMDYVKEGGNLIVQYNTSNNTGTVKAKIGPYNFNITRNRITDETARVTLLDPAHKAFNFPNKITQKDFEDWVQERSIYHASGWDNHLKPLLSMADPGGQPDEGSLITGKYGKGYFTYTGLVFYRELPAAVPGALRLMANLIALNANETTVKK